MGQNHEGMDRLSNTEHQLCADTNVQSTTANAKTWEMIVGKKL